MIEWAKQAQEVLSYSGLTIPLLGVLLLGGLLALVAIWMFWRAQHSENVAFDAAEMFQDRTGKTSGMKVLSFNAGLLSFWVIAWQTVNQTLTAETFTIWLAIVVAGKIGSDFVDRMPGSGKPTK